MIQGMARRRSNTTISRSEPRFSVNTNDNQPDSRPNRDQRGSVHITDDNNNSRIDPEQITTASNNGENSFSVIPQSHSNESNSTTFQERTLLGETIMLRREITINAKKFKPKQSGKTTSRPCHLRSQQRRRYFALHKKFDRRRMPKEQ